MLVLSIRHQYLSQRCFGFLFYTVLIPALFGDSNACSSQGFRSGSRRIFFEPRYPRRLHIQCYLLTYTLLLYASMLGHQLRNRSAEAGPAC